MGICCGKTHPEIIQVEGKKEVATSTSSLKYESQDAQNVSSEKESQETETCPLPLVDTTIVADPEDLFDTVAARTRYSTFKYDRDYDPVRRTSVYIEGRRISQDEDQIRHNLAGQRPKSEGVTNKTDNYFPKKLSLPEGQALLDYKECLKSFNTDDVEEGEDKKDEVVEEFFNRDYEPVRRTSTHIEGRRISQGEDQINHNLTGQRRNSEGVTNKTDKYFPKKLSLPEGQALLDFKECLKGFNTDDIEEGDGEGDKEDEAMSASQDAESNDESFFDVKGEMLSLFNKLEADTSFIHSIKDQDLKSTTSEEQSSNGDYSLLREMEAIFLELKQQQDAAQDADNEASSSHSKSEQESDVESFFDMSNEIENIVSKFDNFSVSSKSSEIQKISEEEPSLTPAGDSLDSGRSFFHIQGEMESRLQNLVLHLGGSGSDEESQCRNDEISEKGLSSAEGSYFNMQEEIELRLDLIRQGSGNFI